MSSSSKTTPEPWTRIVLYAIIVALAVAATSMMVVVPNRSKVIDLVYRSF